MSNRQNRPLLVIETVCILLLLVTFGILISKRINAPEAVPSVSAEVELPSDAKAPAQSAAPSEAPAASLPPDPAETSVRISELMASNETCLLDGDNDLSDWLELTNTGSEPAELSGWWLSDDPENPRKWQIPELVLAPGEIRVIFCSGKDRGGAELHTSFSLSSAGETVSLAAPGGTVLEKVTYADVKKNQSVCFEGGSASYSYFSTPGYPNTAEGYETFIGSHDKHGALTVNEAVLYNLDYEKHGGDYYDWVELKNTSSAAIELSDYRLSDDIAQLDKFTLPSVTLEPGAVTVVFCSGNEELTDEAHVHAGFSISSEGEALYLTTRSGEISDLLYIHDTPYGGSCGRKNGEAGFFYYSVPTPNADNSGSCARAMAEAPVPSVEQGVYNGTESLSVELLSEGEVYYTLDGTAPSKASTLYSAPITVSRNTVIRAVAYREGFLPSEVAAFSYILNQNDSLPVASLVCDPGDFSRVYNNGYAENTANASVSFFEEGGSFTADCSIKLHGASSRTTWSKKSMKLTFRGRLGGDLQYDLFGDGKITSFHSLLLRGGSDSELETLRDEFASLLALSVCPENYDFLTLNVKYCILYVNGEYYGLYCWREAYSEEYVASHTGSDAKNVSIARAPVGQGDIYKYISFVLNNDMGSADNYAYAASGLDMKSLAYWAALESYFHNRDIDGNIRYVRGDVPDALWKQAFFDLDFCVLDLSGGWYTTFSDTYQLGKVLLRLRSNPDFRETLLQCTAELYKNGLDEEKALAAFDGIMELLDEQTVRRDCQRWGWGYDYWKVYSDQMRTFLTHERTRNWILGLGNILSMSEASLKEYFGEF